MCRYDCQLTRWNKNCSIPIRFRTPVCQMNENGEISAESQQNFHSLPHFNSKTTESIFTIFLHDVVQLVELLMRISARRWCISFQYTKAKTEDSQLWRLQKSPKINWLPSQRPLDWRKTYVSFVILIHIHPPTLKRWWRSVIEIFGEIGRILPCRFKSTNFSHLNLWHYWTKLHHICTRCRRIISTIKLFIHIAIFYSILKCQGAE